MLAKDFNFQQFGYFLEEKQKLLKKLMNNEYRGPVLTQRVCGDTFGVASQTREKSLADQLDCMNIKMQLHSDVAFGYLEPWCGVGVYANAFGAPLFRYAHCDVQTKSRYHDVEEVANVPMPKAGECELMQEALEFTAGFSASYTIPSELSTRDAGFTVTEDGAFLTVTLHLACLPFWAVAYT